MTPEQIKIVRSTFAQVMVQKMEAGRLFYDRLFVIAPDTRAMFRGDVDVQARKLMDTLALAVGAIARRPGAVGNAARLGTPSRRLWRTR